MEMSNSWDQIKKIGLPFYAIVKFNLNFAIMVNTAACLCEWIIKNVFSFSIHKCL